MAKQSKGIPTVALAVVVAVAAYWYWSPLLVVHQMKEAVRAHDVEAFNSHVDFPALRESMKDEMTGRPSEGALDSLGRMLGGVVVDVLVRPETVMFVLEHGDFSKQRGGARSETDPAPPARGAARTKWLGERAGGNRHKRRQDKIALVFVRNGFADWKLSELRL